MTAAIAGPPAVRRRDAATAADAAMAALLLVSAGAGLSFALHACAIFRAPTSADDGKPVREERPRMTLPNVSGRPMLLQ